ncbi:MAG: hypothetical protein IPK67_18745 [Planctomycetes bacterium]|nr:hypothetical protein [Planctomycetota bacterium]
MPVSAEEYDFWTRQAQRQLEAAQGQVRREMEGHRVQAEFHTRRELNAWAARNVGEDGKLSQRASLSEAGKIIDGQLEKMHAKAAGGVWPPRSGAEPDYSTIQGAAAEASRIVESWAENVQLDSAAKKAEAYLRTQAARAMHDDHRRNVAGVRERESRQAKEVVARWKAGRESLETIGRNLESWGINAGIWQLSTDAHLLAFGRNHLGEIGDAAGAQRWVAMVSPERAAVLRPEGRTASVAFRTFSQADLDRLFRSVNAGRRTFTSARTMGLGFNTGEVYFPLPRELEGALEGRYRAQRRDFLAGRRPSFVTSRAGVARDLEAFQRKLSADLAAGSELSPQEIDRLVERLSRLLGDVRNGTL